MLGTFLMMAAMAAEPQPLKCERQGDRIEINLPSDMNSKDGLNLPDIDSMAVIKNGLWLTLADDTVQLAPFKSDTKHLTLKISEQMGSYIGKKDIQLVKVFDKPGTYEIIFTDNLETEPENMLSISCKVKIR